MIYSVDTSALGDAWVRYYPPDVFHTLWKRLDGLVAKGRLLAIDEVQRELEKKDDELLKWVAERPAMIVPLDNATKCERQSSSTGFHHFRRRRASCTGGQTRS